MLDAPQPGQYDRHQGARAGRLDVEPGSDSDTERRDDPDRRRRGEAGDHAAALHDRSRTDETDSGDDLRRQPRGIADARSRVRQADADRHIRQQRGTDANENVRTKPRGLAFDLALQTDRAAKDDGERELEQQVEAKRADELRH